MSMKTIVLLCLCILDAITSKGWDGIQSSFLVYPDGPWNLPIFPAKLPHPYSLANLSTTNSNGKLIPRHLWVAIRDADDTLNYQMPLLFDRNKGWEVHVTSNKEKDEFMNTVFANTSILWAYHALHPEAGAAKADIWRYCVLWTYGGAYIDDDSDMRKPFDEIVQPNDAIIISYEKNSFNGDVCWIPRYHLSDFKTFHNNDTRKAMNVFYGRVILNWAMFSSPHHPFIGRTLRNIVEVMKHEYFHDAVLRHLRAAYRWQLVMCGTGPSLFTASAREVLFEDPSVPYTLAIDDFRDHGGKFKAIRMKISQDKKHYMHKDNLKKGLLSEYYSDTHPEANKIPGEILKLWEGEAVQGQNGKQIFVIENLKKRGIQNYDTFMALNYTMPDVRVIADEKLDSIPNGDPMPYMDYKG